jgi:hypothetical protein
MLLFPILISDDEILPNFQSFVCTSFLTMKFLVPNDMNITTYGSICLFT